MNGDPTRPLDRPVGGGATALAQVLRALRHRNYRLFFGGQGVSLIGSFIQMTALQLLVYRLGEQAYGPKDPRIAMLLGLIGFSGQIMTFLISPFAGVIIDRVNVRRLLVFTQSLATTLAATLAVLTLAGVVAIWQIMSLAALLGLVMAFDITGRQSFVVQMVGRKEDLPNAIALNSSLVNGAKLIGPAIAGFLVYKIGEGPCFALNAASYLFVIAALLAMRVSAAPPTRPRRKVLAGLKEGFAYAAGHAPIRSVLMLLAFVSLVGMSYGTLMPIFADHLAGGLARDPLQQEHLRKLLLGFLIGATGLGALTGALFLAGRPSVLGLGRWIATAPAIFGAALVMFGLSRSLWLSLPLLVAAGFGMMVQMASSNTIIQTLVDDDKRGRVMSLYAMSFMGMGPFGSLLMGWVARHFGAPTAVVAGGVACILASAAFATRLPKLREAAYPAYVRMGILPPPPDGGAPAGDQERF